MNDINSEAGLRLRDVRHIINEGGKLSAEQFAHIIGETRDRIINYELGRSSVPFKVLYELYRRGINPVYIIAGEGSIFAENEAGRQLEGSIMNKSGVNLRAAPHRFNADTSDDYSGKPLKAAAGKIKRKNPDD